MMFKDLTIATMALATGLGLAGCTDGYGRGGAPLGYESGYYDGFDGGYGYAGSSFGWYGDYYYPGTGVYVFDRYRRPYRWNDNQRAYWQARGSGERRFGNRGGFGASGSAGVARRANAPSIRQPGEVTPQTGFRQRAPGENLGQYRQGRPPTLRAHPSAGRPSYGSGRPGGRGRR